MRLSLSNLAFPADVDLSGFAALGVHGVEVALTRIAPWDALTQADVEAYRRRIAAAGLQVSSLQALMFGTAGLQLLADPAAFAAMAEHLRRVAALGALMGASIGVFGAPKNRLRGHLSDVEAWDRGRQRLGRLADMMVEEGFVLGLEPVPGTYGGDFLTGADAVIRMVGELNNPGIRVHLDTGCVLLAGDDIGAAIAAAGPLLGHFHVAEPGLGTFDAPHPSHDAAAAALARLGYQSWVAIEMLEQPVNPLSAIRQSIEFARRTYFRP